jgi:hypothetical protein
MVAVSIMGAAIRPQPILVKMRTVIPGRCQPVRAKRPDGVEPGMTVVYLDEIRARLYIRAHDQRCDHPYRSPPPHLSGMGGHLRLRVRPCRRIRSAAFSLPNAV